MMSKTIPAFFLNDILHLLRNRTSNKLSGRMGLARSWAYDFWLRLLITGYHFHYCYYYYFLSMIILNMFNFHDYRSYYYYYYYDIAISRAILGSSVVEVIHDLRCR